MKVSKSVIISWGANAHLTLCRHIHPKISTLGQSSIFLENMLLYELNWLPNMPFADDFSFIFWVANIAIWRKHSPYPSYANFWNHYASLSSRKSQVLELNKARCLDFDRSPVMSIHAVSMHHAYQIKTIGIIIDSSINWIPYINHSKVKLFSYQYSLLTGIEIHESRQYPSKIWYLTIIERIITYGHASWAM